MSILQEYKSILAYRKLHELRVRASSEFFEFTRCFAFPILYNGFCLHLDRLYKIMNDGI